MTPEFFNRAYAGKPVIALGEGEWTPAVISRVEEPVNNGCENQVICTDFTGRQFLLNCVVIPHTRETELLLREAIRIYGGYKQARDNLTVLFNYSRFLKQNAKRVNFQ